jgi:hypothetical protein
VPHPISKLKTRLSTIPTDSRRYRFVNFFWEDPEKIEGAKACKFYWIMIPASAIGSVILGIIMLLFWILVVPIAWFLGYTPTPETTKKKDKLPSHIPTDKMLLPKGYSPRTGEYRKHNPWYYVLPFVGVGVIVAGLSNGMLWEAFLAIGNFLQAAWPYFLGIAVIIGACWIIGVLYKKRQFRFSAWWNKACPPLVVVQVEDKEQAQA